MEDEGKKESDFSGVRRREEASEPGAEMVPYVSAEQE